MNAEMLRQMFDYNAETGQFINRRSMPGLRAGTEAGCKAGPHGYTSIRIHGRLYMAHRVAFLYVTGAWPRHVVDHIDGNRLEAAGTGSHGEPASVPLN